MENSQESDVRVLMAEMRHMRQDVKDTNAELRSVAKSLHEVAKNMTADRGRIDSLEARASKRDEREITVEQRIRALEDFATIEKPRSARAEKVKGALIGGVIMLAISLTAKSILSELLETKTTSHYESSQSH